MRLPRRFAPRNDMCGNWGLSPIT